MRTRSCAACDAQQVLLSIEWIVVRAGPRWRLSSDQLVARERALKRAFASRERLQLEFELARASGWNLAFHDARRRPQLLVLGDRSKS